MYYEIIYFINTSSQNLASQTLMWAIWILKWLFYICWFHTCVFKQRSKRKIRQSMSHFSTCRCLSSRVEGKQQRTKLSESCWMFWDTLMSNITQGFASALLVVTRKHLNRLLTLLLPLLPVAGRAALLDYPNKTPSVWTPPPNPSIPLMYSSNWSSQACRREELEFNWGHIVGCLTQIIRSLITCSAH